MAHYIRTIHTDFTASASSSPRFSSSWSSHAGTSASAHSNLLAGLSGIMNKYPPGLGHSEWRPSPASGSTGANPSPYTRRRTGISIRAPHSPPSRRTPASGTPSFRTQPASTTYMKFDPFSDDFAVDPSSSSLSSLPPRRNPLHAPTDSVLYRTPRASPASLVHLAPTVEVAPSPALAPPLDPNARSRLVAGILLNRVHAVGKPMRRRSMDAPKEYVKSGLSRVMSAEA